MASPLAKLKIYIITELQNFTASDHQGIFIFTEMRRRTILLYQMGTYFFKLRFTPTSPSGVSSFHCSLANNDNYTQKAQVQAEMLDFHR